MSPDHVDDRETRRDDAISRSALVNGLGFGVLMCLLASTAADIASASYATPYPLYGLMGVILGGVFANGNFLNIRKRIAKALVPEEDDEERERA